MVFLFLLAEGGGGSGAVVVAGVDLGVVWEGADYFVEGVVELTDVAAGEVGAAASVYE